MKTTLYVLGAAMALAIILAGCSNPFTAARSASRAGGQTVDRTIAATPSGTVTVSEQARLTLSDYQGRTLPIASVAATGDTVVAGNVTASDSTGARSGEVAAFVPNGAGWSQQVSLGYGDNYAFGSSVAIDGATMVVGAPESNGGYAFVYVRNGTAWSLQARIVNPRNAYGTSNFGWSVAISGDTIVVGSVTNGNGPDVGDAFVYVRNGTTWSEQALLSPNDAIDPSAGGFGSVAIDGDTVVVGASSDSHIASDAGSAYVFVRNGTTWSQEAKLTAPDAAANDWFGHSVAISGDTALVASDSGGGAAYAFIRSGTTWSEQAKLTSGSGISSSLYAVALDGNTALIGAPQASGGTGAAYLWLRNGGSWSEQATLSPSSASDTTFGSMVALRGGVAFVAASGNFAANPCAYVYSVTVTPPPATGFSDSFNRPDGADIGNGWIEKNTSAFSLQNGRVVKASSWGYRDIIAYRPAGESLLNVQAQTEFTDTTDNQWAPGSPQIWVRVRNDTVATGGSLDGYVLFIDDSPDKAAIALENGSEQLSWMQDISLSSPVMPGGTYRLTLSALGTNPVRLSADIEAQTGSGWQSIGSLDMTDASASRISTAGTVGFSGGTAGGRYAYDNFAYQEIPQ